MDRVVSAVVKWGIRSQDYEFGSRVRNRIVCTFSDGEEAKVWDHPSVLAPYRCGDTVYLLEKDGRYRVIGSVHNFLVSTKYASDAVKELTGHLEDRLAMIETRIDDLANEIASGDRDSDSVEGTSYTIEQAVKNLIEDLDCGNISFEIGQSSIDVSIKSIGDSDCLTVGDEMQTVAVFLNAAIRKHFSKMLSALLEQVSNRA